MKNHVWSSALEACADPQRARQYHDQLAAAGVGPALKDASPEAARALAALFSGSQALSEWLLAHPQAVESLLDFEALRFARASQGFRREVDAWLRPTLVAGDFADALAQLRQFKQRETLRIATRDLAGLSNVSEVTRELSDLADVCLDSVHRLCWEQLTRRLGVPHEETAGGAWVPTSFCVLGMGKLGGQELNYSSDVDVLFVYSEEGFVFKEPPRKGSASGKGVPSHDFFRRLCETFIAEVGRAAPEGMLYRIDLRLRPEGRNGPLARSLESYENYYAQWGQTWERMMLIKARRVAGDPELAHEFLGMVQPFRFPRSLTAGAPGEIVAMKRRIETEVVRAGELDRNVKLGRGGIREIEFVAQMLQILHAGKQPFLGGTQTCPTLLKLTQYHLLSAADSEALVQAYEFLRNVEHRLQMENNLQTHTLPTERRARERLARLMGLATLKEFESALDNHRAHVRRVYEEMLEEALAAEPEGSASEAETPDIEGNEAAWRLTFENHNFRDPEKALRLAGTFMHGPGFGHVSARTEAFARRLLGRMLALCPPRDTLAERRKTAGTDGDPNARWLSDPDRVLARLDSFIAAYGSRAMLLETWNSQQSLFELLLLLFDRSEFLAETAIRTPDLIDDLAQSGRLRESRTVARTLADLRHGADDPDQRAWIRRYHEAEFTRIGLRDILGLADFEQNLVELSALADACLQYALETALRHHRLKTAPLAIIGLGKLGGSELNYGSDLDVVFVADDKTKNLPALQRVAVEVIDLISGKTAQGQAFELDARLRPDGEKGLLVNNLKAYEQYYRNRAQLWEIQAISRCRPVAGSAEVGNAFVEAVGRFADFSRDDSPCAARTPDWRQQVARMRQRIEKERTPVGKHALAIKTGAGGLMDAEFIAQTLCLAHGWREPTTLRALQRAQAEGALHAGDAALLIENYRRLRRVEGILRRWSYEGETELPAETAPQYRVAVRCGFATVEDFLEGVARYRRHIRAAYAKVMGAD